MNLLLLTGSPGAGKTTVIRKLASRLTGWNLAGFYTEEVRDGGSRRGFNITSLDGRCMTMANIEMTGSDRVGRYHVDVAAVDAVSLSALAAEPAADAYLVDEIGPMECLSAKFVSSVRDLIGSGALVVATVAERGGGFIDEIKHLSGVIHVEVTRRTRDALPDRIVAWLEKQRAARQVDTSSSGKCIE